MGNIAQIDKDVSILSHVLLARQYGEIYRLYFPGKIYVFSLYDDL